MEIKYHEIYFKIYCYRFFYFSMFSHTRNFPIFKANALIFPATVAAK